MAEIKIEKKTPKWPWVLVILAVLAVVAYFVLFGDESPDRMAENTETQEQVMQEPLQNSSVSAFVTFIDNDPDKMGLDHEFTNDALMKLTNATEAMSSEIDYDIEKDIEEVRKLAKKIKEDPFETTHANSIREAAGILAGAMDRMQSDAFPDLSSEANKVKKAANDINVDVLTLEQKGDVKGFFRESADLLEKMNNQQPEI